MRPVATPSCRSRCCHQTVRKRHINISCSLKQVIRNCVRMCVSVAVNLLSQKYIQCLRSPSQHTLHQIYHHVMTLCGWTVDLPQTGTGFAKSLPILWDEKQLLWNKKCRVFFFFFFMGQLKVLVRRIQYYFAIYVVDTTNHSCRVWRYCSIHFIPMLPHTPLRAVSVAPTVVLAMSRV